MSKVIAGNYTLDDFIGSHQLCVMWLSVYIRYIIKLEEVHSSCKEVSTHSFSVIALGQAHQVIEVLQGYGAQPFCFEKDG